MVRMTLQRIKRRIRSVPRRLWHRIKPILIRPRKDLLPRITVITPVFNGADTIRETIESVINQHYANLEYIVVDGGSTDDSLAIVDEYREHISEVISEPDRGMY